MRTSPWIGVLLLIGGYFLFPGLTHAQTPCGSITGPEEWLYQRPLITTPIQDCDNPFDTTTGAVSPYTVKINGVAVEHNGSITVPAGGATSYEIEGEPETGGYRAFLFLHEGSDYRYIDTTPPTPTEADYRALADAFFPQDTLKEEYIQAALNRDRLNEMDAETSTQFWLFMQYAEEHYTPTVPALRAGTYTYVIREYGIFMVRQHFLERIVAHLIPTAYADEGPSVFAVTFHVVEEAHGASSIVFLPGIMGSRLYEESAECDSDVAEQERWVTRDECAQLRLMTNIAGASIHNLYTRAHNDSVIDETYSFNLYKTFLHHLHEWKEEGVIVDYAAVPYDWRLRLDAILKSRVDLNTGKITYDVGSTLEEGYLYQTISSLAETSASGKVTLVAHSNGGLVAKAFLASLQITNDPLVRKIDRLILVGVPQVGTPNAIVGMLHGTEVGPGGIIISQEMTRRLMSTMPFARHLLPTKSYFSGNGVTTQTPVIQFESGEETTSWSTAFGSTITDETSLRHFISTESGRVAPASDDLLHPAVADTFLFDYATTIALLIESFVPQGIRVYQVAGVGLNTPSGITYYTDRECVSRNPLRLFVCTAYAQKLGYRVNHTVDGDGTVVSPSALAMKEDDGVERWWLNFRDYNKDNVMNRKHNDMFEIQDIIDFVRNTLESNEDHEYTYLSDAEPTLPREDRLEFTLHSPLDMSLTTVSGEEVSSTTSTIRGAVYRRYGELQYISLPDTSTHKTLILRGEGKGSFTLDIEAHGSDGAVDRHTYSAIPSDTQTLVQIAVSNSDSVPEAVLSVDYDGNGTSDATYNEQGIVEKEVSYNTLIETLSSLTLKSAYKKVLVQTALTARTYDEKSNTHGKFEKLERLTLFVLIQQLTLYERLRLISSTEKQYISSIIETLIK
jgi:hypothetical protein